jgi:Recombination directionality factor-like
MPILDLQRRLREAGRIRIGHQVATANGKTRPAKLNAFRLTSQDQTVIEAAASLFGGQPRHWDKAPVGDQWELYTTTAAIPVVVPPAATVFSQWYELWTGGGCVRRCDGETELINDVPCLCVTEDERVCTPHSRLNVILRDLPGLGVWRLDTSGWYAATELAGTVEVIVQAATRGQLLPAVLRLEQRQVKRPEEPTRKFAVPVLDIAVTPTALGLVIGTGAAGELPAAPVPVGPEQSWQPIEPAPGNGEPAPGETADAIRGARTPTPKRRSNSPPDLPSTGLHPRGDLPTEPTDDTLSEAQMRKLRALYGAVGITGTAEQKKVTAILLGVERIATHAKLTVDQASAVIDLLSRVETGDASFTLDADGNVIGIADAEQASSVVDAAPAAGEADAAPPASASPDQLDLNTGDSNAD